MADRRKLQTEIDRCIRTVNDKVEVFEETWEKVQSASNANQKDKYEGDLKKEIKKLQRLRDQIKTWLAGNDAKAQRNILLEKRKLIEIQMERFKVIERETKTKAFSKEGLAAAAKVDPREQEKSECREWLNECVNHLQMQVEQLEAEMAGLNSGKKKKSSKALEKETKINERIARHNFHVSKLEMLMRLLDNDTVEDLDRRIKDSLEEDVNYYISDNQEADFAENEYLYEDFDGLVEEAGNIMKDQTKLKQESEKEEKKKEKLKAAQKKEEQMKEELRAKEAAKKKAEAEAAAAKLKEKQAQAAAVRAKSAPEATTSTPTSTFTAAPQPKLSAGINFAAAAGAAKANEQKAKSPPATASVPQPSWNGGPPGTVLTAPASPGKQGVKPPAGATSPGGASLGPRTMPSPSFAASAGNMPPSSPSQSQIAAQQQQRAQLSQAKPPSADNLIPGDSLAALQLLNVSAQLIPEQQEHARSYTPATPTATPTYYPQHPPPHFSQPSFFANLDTDTLLFVFYYQQGTYQQYLAARELKKQAWRFHKKYLTWFQRHEEPKIITDEFEQGTYVYFDFEAGWCQRKKTDFTFEYRFLEDNDLP
eukprot:m.333921 g.333921  ORF g.333921 m.333921 type:complete len:593 (+) comp17246_c0_seq1:2847-4625(+)